MQSNMDTNAAPAIARELIEPSGGAGLETAWGFLLRTEPGSLALMLDPELGLVEADARARAVAKRMGSPVHVKTVTLPRLREAGLRHVGSYQAAVLERVFPVSP